MNNKQKIKIIAMVMIFIASMQLMVVAQNDRATFRLKGNVTKVTQIRDSTKMIYESYDPFGCSDLEFSSTGEQVRVDGWEIKKETSEDGVYYRVEMDEDNDYELWYQKDSQGRITANYYMSGCGDGYDTIIYDDKGRAAQKISKAYEESRYNDLGELEAGKYVVVSDVKYFYDEKDNLIKVVVYYPLDKKTHTVTYQYKLIDRTGNWLIRVANCASLGMKDYIERRKIEY